MDTLTAPTIKEQLRKELKHKRRLITPDQAEQAGWRVANAIRSVAAHVKPSIVALYLPINGEIDLMGLVSDLKHDNNMRLELALPRVAQLDSPLVFNKWYPGARWDHDKEGLKCAVGPEVEPSLIVMPCLGFDRRGYRLGYGKGYYDRTLRQITYKTTTVAVTYSALEVPELPTEYHDIPADYVATERELIRCRG